MTVVADDRDDFERYAATRDRRLRNQLVTRHQHLVEIHVRRYASSGYQRDDVRQVALVGLIKAVERFDPTRGVRFATFADRTISGELKRFARNQSWSVRPPRALQEVYLEVVAAEAQLTQVLRRLPTVAEVAAELDRSQDEVLEALEAGGARRAASYDVPAAESGESSHAAPPSGDDDGFDSVERRVLVDELLARLTPRELAVVELTVLQANSQDHAAAALGVSQSYVSRTRRHALDRLRRLLERAGAPGLVGGGAPTAG
jgi:RNA polymerase sigma-B factor